MEKEEMVLKVLQAMDNGDDKVEMKFNGIHIKGYDVGDVQRIDIKTVKP